MKHIGIVMLVLGVCLASAVQVQAQQAHKITTINGPGAGNSQGQGTIPFGIVDDGSIMGSYIDSSNVIHGFLRNPKTGHITKINFPGSATTFANGMNSAKVITGSYPDSSGVVHGFLRSPSGHYTSFDAPGAGTGSGQGTFAGDVNTKGEIVGNYADSNGVNHVFFRTLGNKYSTFDAPGAGTGSGQGTSVSGFSGLTDKGAIAGNYTDSNGISHGFRLTGSGKFTGPIDPTGSINTFAIGLSLNNTFAGIYFDSTHFVHAFLLTVGGTYIPVNAPNSVETAANNINPGGTIEGLYFDSSGVEHAYVRAPGGHFTEFSVHGGGTGSGQGTSANSSNSSGAIAGNIVDSNGVNHGFLRQ
jgi:hypothetical protein